MNYKFFKYCETVEELYSQYKRLAMEHHPDRGGRVEDMQAINAEYDVLKKIVGNKHKTADGKTYERERNTTPDRFKNIINAVIGFNIDLEICGCWLWAFKAYKYREELKALGFFYCSRKMAWAWTEEMPSKHKHKMTLDEIRETYGSEIIKTQTEEEQQKRIGRTA